jgi:tetratricopeptide (TPR) repeat protein
VHAVLKSVESGPEEPSDQGPYSPYEPPAISNPVNPSVVAVNCASPVPPTFPGSYHGGGVTLEGMDDVVEAPDFGTDPVKARLVVENLPSPVPTSPSGLDRSVDITLEGMDDNIMGLSDVGLASSSTERPRPTPESASSHCLPTLHEIKQRIEQFTEGGFERTYLLDQVRVLLCSAEKLSNAFRLISSHISQSEPSNRVQLRRCAVRLLMTSASFSPADFSSPVGFLGRTESTPYYPTGDLQKDRIVAFTAAMDCLDHLEVHLPGNDDIRIATTLFELTQALSDLGLHKYALDTSGFALDTLEHPYVATPEGASHHVASILSLRGSILCDLKQNDEAVDAAHRAVILFREHRDSQNTPIPELAFASLNYAVLLNSIGLKDECAAVVFEFLGEVDESQPDMKDVSALCNLCLSNMRFDAEDGTDLSATEETIKLTRTSSDAVSQTALAGALLNKSKILSSGGQNEAAISFSAEAVTLLHGMSATRPVFSLFLAHALDNHARILLQANYKCESHSIRHDAIELWQTLKVPAPDPIARPLAWSLFELSKFRHEGGERNVLREELRIAECAVDAFRGVVPLDIPGLADALYLFAVRMLELDENREAATYAEESVQYFREASAEDPKYALDLIFSLSLASSCLAYTERDEDAFEYAKQAVEVQRGRKGLEDKQYDAHLRRLLMDVVNRAMEMDKMHEALPWLPELQTLDPSIGTHKFSHFDQ